MSAVDPQLGTATFQMPVLTRLPDLCGEAFAFALSLRAAKDPGDADALRAKVSRILDRLSQRASTVGIDPAQVDHARYAVCALLDEVVLGSRWDIRTQWINRPLQMLYFQDFTAGEQFYTRLAEIRGNRTPQGFDLVEVYAQCLAAGFRGKFADLAGMPKLAELLAELNRELRRARGIETRSLSRQFEREAALPQVATRVPAWVVAAGGMALVLALLFVLDTILASQAAAFLADAQGGR